jgi:DNA-binding NarL/FixJ family response regulator
MNDHPLLVENESKRLTFRLPLLLCFAMFAAWQMGLTYFSSKTLSVNAGTSLPPLSEDITTPLVVVGYLLAIAVMVFLPHVIVWAQRITIGLALAGALYLFLPLSQEALTPSLYVQYFCCCFLIGFETAVIVNLFSEKSAVLHLTVAYALVGCGVPALLQNDFGDVPFGVFRLFAVVACVLQLFFYCMLPGRSWPRYIKKADGIACPKMLFGMIFLMDGLTALMTFFGNSIAETVPHGITMYYLFVAVYGLIVFALWKWLHISPIRCASALIGIAAIGFVAAIVSLHVPAFSLVSCALLAAGMTALGIQPLYGMIMAKRYPSRFIAPAIIGLAFAALLIHAALLPVLSENPTMQYVIYLAITIVLAVLFFMLMPYLLYMFRGHSIQEIVDAHNEAAEETPAPAAAASAETHEPSAHGENEIRCKLRIAAITPLTPREYEVAEMTVLGIKQSVIADTLDILPGTVNNHRSHVYDKFGVSNREELLICLGKLSRKLPDKEAKGNSHK